jgi:hypothetical protein
MTFLFHVGCKLFLKKWEGGGTVQKDLAHVHISFQMIIAFVSHNIHILFQCICNNNNNTYISLTITAQF